MVKNKRISQNKNLSKRDLILKKYFSIWSDLNLERVAIELSDATPTRFFVNDTSLLEFLQIGNCRLNQRSKDHNVGLMSDQDRARSPGPGLQQNRGREKLVRDPRTKLPKVALVKFNF